jgi:hypothetical protein
MVRTYTRVHATHTVRIQRTCTLSCNYPEEYTAVRRCAVNVNLYLPATGRENARRVAVARDKRR